LLRNQKQTAYNVIMLLYIMWES